MSPLLICPLRSTGTPASSGEAPPQQRASLACGRPRVGLCRPVAGSGAPAVNTGLFGRGGVRGQGCQSSCRWMAVVPSCPESPTSAARLPVCYSGRAQRTGAPFLPSDVSSVGTRGGGVGAASPGPGSRAAPDPAPARGRPPSDVTQPTQPPSAQHRVRGDKQAMAPVTVLGNLPLLSSRGDWTSPPSQPQSPGVHFSSRGSLTSQAVAPPRQPAPGGPSGQSTPLGSDASVPAQKPPEP